LDIHPPKLSGDPVYGSRVLDSKAKMMQARRQRFVFLSGKVRGSQHEPEVAVEVLDVAITFVDEGAFPKTKDRHYDVVKAFGPGQIDN